MAEDLYKELYEKMLGIHKTSLQTIDIIIRQYTEGIISVETMINKIANITAGGERM